MNGIIRALGLVMIVCATGTFSQAQDPTFRVDTDIYLGESKVPAKQTLTIFREGVYYDFAVDNSAAITIIDPKRNRIVLINPARHAKTTLETGSLLRLVAEAKQKAAEQPATSDLSRMMKAAERTSYDAERQILSVGDSTSLLYEAKMNVAAGSEQALDVRQMAAQYADFADWSARLNAVYPPRLIPFVRLELNRQIAALGALPQEIKRIERHDRKQSEIRSRLLVIYRISATDEAKLDTAGKLLVSCEEVSPEKYFEVPTQISQQQGAGAAKR